MFKRICASLLIILTLNYFVINDIGYFKNYNVAYATGGVIGQTDTVTTVQKVILGVGFVIMGWQHTTENALLGQINNFVTWLKGRYTNYQEMLNSWLDGANNTLNINQAFIDEMTAYKNQGGTIINYYTNVIQLQDSAYVNITGDKFFNLIDNALSIPDGRYIITLKVHLNSGYYKYGSIYYGLNNSLTDTSFEWHTAGDYYKYFKFDKITSAGLTTIKHFKLDGTTQTFTLTSSNPKIQVWGNTSTFSGTIGTALDREWEYSPGIDYYPDAVPVNQELAVPGTVVKVKEGVDVTSLVGQVAIENIIDGSPSIPSDTTGWTNLWDWLSKILEAINPIAAIKTAVDAILEKLQLTELWDWLRQIAEAINPIAAIKTAIDAINGKLDIGVLQDNITGQLTDSFKGKFNIDRLTKTWDKLMAMDTSRGDPPVIKINLYAMANTSLLKFAPNTKNPFANEDSTLIDFGLINNYKFLGIPFVDLIRTLIGFGMLYYTLLHVWNKITPRQVIGE
jgi:hypothetical protein